MKRSNLRLGCAAVVLLVAACGGGGATGELPQPLAFAEVTVSAYSGVKTPRNSAIRTAAAWTALWGEHTAAMSPPPPQPAIAIPPDTVAAVFLGEVNNCLRPSIQSVARTSAAVIEVRYRIVAPGPTELCTAAILTPAQMVRFDNATQLPVEFVRLP